MKTTKDLVALATKLRAKGLSLRATAEAINKRTGESVSKDWVARNTRGRADA